MARKKLTFTGRRPTLQMPRSEAEARIREQIEKGRKLLEPRIGSEAALEWVRREEAKWSDFNIELLNRIVDTDDLAEEYPTFSSILSFDSFLMVLPKFRSDVRSRITCLESILSRLELIPESPVLAPQVKEQPVGSYPELGRRVFVVHGHDPEAKQSVARCLEKLELEAIILHEKPSRGQTIIEKFEDYADVGFAVVLLTPDDVGAAKKDMDNLKPRARQNVVFELGFFIGRLGRQRVCALLKGDVEIPSDFAGVLWVPMDPQGAWRLELVREMRAAGLDVDPNKLL